MTESLSIGNELKDSYDITKKWVDTNIDFLHDIDSFYKERAALELDYSVKLRELTKKYFDKKADKSAVLSVGSSPTITPGSLQSASLVLWTDILTQTEAIASEKKSFSEQLTSKVCDNLISLRNKSTHLSTQLDSIHDYLTTEKKNLEENINKSKKTYDSLCQQTESAREKKEKSEKYLQKFSEKETSMNDGKNDYLISLSIANRLKDKYYYQDIPEILDYFQELNESKTSILNKLLKNAGIIERNSIDRCKEKLFLIDSTIDQNVPKLDTAMFINHNVQAWNEPPDFTFIPCSFWHDDDSLIIKEPELTELKRRLVSSISAYTPLESDCINLKQNLEESTASRKIDPEFLTLKFDVQLASTLSILLKFMKQDTNRVKIEVEIETIQNFTGNIDMSYTIQPKEKKSKFGFLKKSKSVKSQNDDNSIHTVDTNHNFAPSSMFSLRRNKSVASGVSSSGTVLYAYTAAGDDEVSIQPGDTFTVITGDNGGWTQIKLSTGESGNVPTSYIELDLVQSQSTLVPDNTGGSKKKGPSVAPKKGAKRLQYVEALYDYNADGDDEISISVGDKIILIQDDNDGSGWTEGELNGEKGMFPTSYVKKI